MIFRFNICFLISLLMNEIESLSKNNIFQSLIYNYLTIYTISCCNLMLRLLLGNVVIVVLSNTI